ncbi:MAG: hypothetical protein U1F61_12620 [Opitutaceae bacterium]
MSGTTRGDDSNALACGWRPGSEHSADLAGCFPSRHASPSRKVIGWLADKSAWHLIADGWGATLHRAELPEDGSMPRPALGALPDGVRLQGAVLRRGREELDLSELGTLTSHALSSDGATLAVTGDGTHAVVLIALN